MCKSHDFLISCFKSEHKKMGLFGTFISSLFLKQDLLRKMTMTTCIKLSIGRTTKATSKLMSFKILSNKNLSR